MISLEIKKFYETALALFTPFESETNFIVDFYANYKLNLDKLSHSLLEKTSGDFKTEAENTRSNIHNRTVEFSKKIHFLSFSKKIAILSTKFENDINSDFFLDFWDIPDEHKHNICRLFNSLENISDNLYEYNTEKVIINSIALIDSCKSFFEVDTEIKYNLHTIDDLLSISSNTVDANENEIELDIYFQGSNDSLFSLIQSLKIIDDLNSQLCDYLAIEDDSKKLKFTKIETGSLLTQLVGNDVVLGIFLSSIVSLTSHIYSQYTKEKKIATYKECTAILKDQIEIRKMLELDDTTDNELSKTQEELLMKLSVGFNKLIRKSTGIKIGDYSLSISKEIHQQYLENATKTLIEEKSTYDKEDPKV